MHSSQTYQSSCEFDPQEILRQRQEQTRIDGDRIRLARESRQLSQEDLAQRISASAPTVHRWEKNVSSPEPQFIAAMAEALDYPESFFAGGGIVTPIISRPQYRTTTYISSKNQRTAEARAYIRYDQVLRAFRKWVDYKWGFSQHDPDEYGGNAEAPAEIARTVRQEWGLGRGPINNLTAAIEARGILIFMERFDDSELDGMSFWADGNPPIIYLNNDRPGERIRFTLAHELGHIIMHRICREHMEVEANRFAAEFLMPEDDIKDDLEDLSLYKLANLKHYWKVSLQSVLYRAKDLNCISGDKSQKLWRELVARGYKKNEPHPLPVETPSLPKLLIEKISKSARVSIEEIAEEMGARPYDININYLGKRLALRGNK